MAKKARFKDSRINEFSLELPCDWGPHKIINPKTGFPFSDATAWELIADLLENGHEASVVDLDKPPGMQALEILYDLDPNQPYLYLKVHMGKSGVVIGRSFHLSTRGRQERGGEANE